ncbi:hypothetical protein GCM10009573_23390 [Agromyces bracchium]
MVSSAGAYTEARATVSVAVTASAGTLVESSMPPAKVMAPIVMTGRRAAAARRRPAGRAGATVSCGASGTARVMGVAGAVRR